MKTRTRLPYSPAKISRVLRSCGFEQVLVHRGWESAVRYLDDEGNRLLVGWRTDPDAAEGFGRGLTYPLPDFWMAVTTHPGYTWRFPSRRVFLAELAAVQLTGTVDLDSPYLDPDSPT